MLRIVLLLVVVLALVGCGSNLAPLPVSDSAQKYSLGTDIKGIPVDTNVYELQVMIVSGPNGLVRQVSPGYARTSTSYNGGYVTSSSYYSPPVIDGKTFLKGYIQRVKVYPNSQEPFPSQATEYLPVGSLVYLKCTDTKCSNISEGETVNLKCRLQYENIAAIFNNETFDAEKSKQVATWEADSCRISTPVFGTPSYYLNLLEQTSPITPTGGSQ